MYLRCYNQNALGTAKDRQAGIVEASWQLSLLQLYGPEGVALPK